MGGAIRAAMRKPGTLLDSPSSAAFNAVSVLPTRATLTFASAASRAMGTIMSDPGTSPTGRLAKRESQTIGLPSATTRSCCA